MSYLRGFSVVLACLGLVACGGGSGSSSSIPSIQQPSSHQSSVGQSSSSIAASITRKTAPAVAGAVVDTFELAANLPFELNEVLNAYLSLPDTTQTVKCDNAKGSAKVKISNSGRLIEEHYETCQLDGTEINGDRIIEIVSSDSVIGASIHYTYKQLVADTLNQPLGKTSLNGLISYLGKAPSYGDSDINFNVNIDLTIDDARDGRLEIKNFKMQAEYNPYGRATDLYENLTRMQSVSGSFSLNNTRFSIEPMEQGVLLKGDNNSRISLTRYQNFNFYVGWDDTGDGLADANLVLPYKEDFSITDMIADGDHKTSILVGRNLVSQIYEGAQVYMARGGVADVYVHPNFTNSSASLLNYELNGKATNGTEWTQLEAGHFRFSFPANSVDTNYELTFTAVDDQGNKSPEIHAKIYVGTDTDKDSVPDVSDEDDDGDRSRDIHDAFPLDPKESKDSDGDGIGDNADPDANSSVQQGSIWFVDKFGVLYYTPSSRDLYPENTRKYFSKRWDVNSKTFLPELAISNYSSYDSHYSKEMHRIYFVSSSRDIYFVDLRTMQETLFAKSNSWLELLSIEFTTANFVVISRTTNEGTVYESYDDKAQLVDSASSKLNGDAISLYAPNLAPFCSFYISIDAAGKFYQRGTKADYRYDKCALVFNRVSLDGRYVYKYRGPGSYPYGIYTIAGELISELSLRITAWFSSGLLVDVNDMFASLYSAQGVLIKQFSLGVGSSIDTVVNNDDQIIISLTLANGKPKIIVLDANLNLISEYEPSGN